MPPLPLTAPKRLLQSSFGEQEEPFGEQEGVQREASLMAVGWLCEGFFLVAVFPIYLLSIFDL